LLAASLTAGILTKVAHWLIRVGFVVVYISRQTGGVLAELLTLLWNTYHDEGSTLDGPWALLLNTIHIITVAEQ
jgi:hypothetical protein